MRKISPYLRLMRLHQPVGIFLLLWPCVWAVTLAENGFPPLRILLLFAIGATFMRAAGCIINDIVDRKLDAEVERTKNRPLASGELSIRQALSLLALLLAASLLVAMELGAAVVMWSALALIPVAIYPWMKRISWWPQLFLGLTFNWGALVGWVAVRGQVEIPAIILYVASVFWTLGYDTIYAHQDKTDDARVGIKSTALRLGQSTKPLLLFIYSLALFGWLVALHTAGGGAGRRLLLALAALHLGWQVYAANLNSPAACKKIFASNAWLGLLVWLAFI